MNDILRFTIIIFGIFFFIISMMLLIRKKLSERIAIVWFLGLFSVLILSFFPQLLNIIANYAGVDYPPSLLYLVAILVLFFLNLYQSIKIVEIQRQLKEVSQIFSILQFQSPKEVNKIADQIMGDTEHENADL